jgi:hypothetical protein
VTAGHAVRAFHDGKRSYHDLELFIDNGNPSNLVPLFGDYIATETARDPENPNYYFQKDILDIAIWELHHQTVDLLSKKSFLTRKQISITAELTRGAYFLAGFPCDWAEVNAADRSLRLVMLPYIAHPYDEPKSLPDFDTRFHMALYLNRDSPMPAKLQGISGCSIWKLTDLPVTDDWKPENARVVAVQTCVYAERDPAALRATRWRWLLPMLTTKRPEIRDAFKLWLPGSE